jgi:F-type H+-transporting ATPase subunit epsilon
MAARFPRRNIVAKAFHCTLVTPEQAMLESEVTYADIPAHDGQMGFMAHHAPALVQLGNGTLKLTFPDHSTRAFRVEGGFAQMNANRLTLVSEKATQLTA